MQTAVSKSMLAGFLRQPGQATLPGSCSGATFYGQRSIRKNGNHHLIDTLQK